jgi:hypothetical protein
MPKPPRFALVFAFAGLAGCLSPRTPASCPSCQGEVVVAAEPSVPAAGVAPGAEARAACEPLLAHNRRVVAAAETKPAREIDYTKACYPVRGGAWAFRLLEWKGAEGGDEGEAQGRYELVYVRDGLAPAVVALPKGFDELSQGMNSADVAPPRFFDFDGDGEPEIFLRRHAHEHEGPSEDEGLLLGWRDGQVRPYEGLPARYDRLEDVDQDGRPDLIYYPYAEEREAPCSGFGYTWAGPAFVAHSLHGGAFAVDDGVARDFVKRACPSRPKPGAAAREGAGDGVETPPELCARVWGAGEAEALALLKRECKPPPPSGSGCDEAPGVCSDYDDRAGALKKALPFVLRE